MIDTMPRVRAMSLLALSLTLLAPATLLAQAADPKRMVEAQALYDQASAEMDASKFASACPKLEQVTHLIPQGLGAKLTLAECYEGLGKLASAWSEYTRVEELATKAGQRERAQKAASKAAALRPRLATLTIEVPDAVRASPGLGITRAGVPVTEAQWGTPLPVDVGEQEVVVTAPGRKRSVVALRVTADGARFSLVVRPLEMEAAQPPPPTSAPQPTSGQPPPLPPHFVVELGVAGLVGPNFAGDGVGLCGKDCSQGIGLGGYGVLRGGYEWSSGLSFGLSAGYLSATQHTAGRKTELNIVGHPGVIPGMQVDEGDSIDSGTTEDVLKLYGFLTGVWVGLSLDAGLPIRLRLGAGGLFGAASDTRSGTFSTSNGKGYPVGPATEAHNANLIYILPEVRVGLPLGRHVEINAGLEVPIHFGVSSPKWSEDHPIHAGPDGYGWFNGEAFMGGVFVGLAPTVGARFDF
jgi:hypothetical protein